MEEEAAEEESQEPKKQNGNLLNKLYYEGGKPGSYATEERLWREAKKYAPKITKREVREYLAKQYVHTRHKRLRKTFPRRKVLTLRIDHTWSADLIQCSEALSRYNKGYNYIVNCIDLFSRKCWVRPIKRKTNKETEEAMRSIINKNQGRSPLKHWTDEGTEWTGLKKLYKEEEIIQYSTKSPLKAVYIERANSSLESIMYRMMTAENSMRWIDYLEDAVSSYDSRKTKTLHGMSPNEAHKKANEEWLRAKFLEDYDRHKKKFYNKKPKFQIGDTVRVAKKRSTFDRGYEPTTEVETRVVEDVPLTTPTVYKLTGKRRKYYGQEMVLVTPTTTKRDKSYYIAKTKTVYPKQLRSGSSTRGSETQYLLKARNQPDLNTWITEEEHQTLKDGGYLG